MDDSGGGTKSEGKRMRTVEGEVQGGDDLYDPERLAREYGISGLEDQAMGQDTRTSLEAVERRWRSKWRPRRNKSALLGMM